MQELSEPALRDLKTWLDEIRPGISQIRARERHATRKHAPRFNLFELLGVASDEVHTHSAFLADLLDPTGRHGQGYDFLNAFLAVIEQAPREHGGPLGPRPRGRWDVARERVQPGFGQPDIVLESAKGLVVIENKVTPEAVESSEQQCSKYDRWRKSREKRWSTLVYLTPKGTEARSMEKRRWPYIRLAYDPDVARWLEPFRKRTLPHSVKTALEQYIGVAKGLSMNEIEMPSEPLVRLLARSKNVENAYRIANAQEALRNHVEERLWAGLTEEIRRHIKGADVRWGFKPGNVGKTYPYLGIRPTPVSEDTERNHLYVAVQLDTSNKRQLTWGVCWHQETPTKKSQPAKVHSLRKKLEKCSEGFRQSPWWLGVVKESGRYLSSPECAREAMTGALPRELAPRVAEFMRWVDKDLEAANRALGNRSRR